MIKKIISIGSLAIILMIPQLHAMQVEKPEKRKISVEVSPSAAEKLNAYETIIIKRQPQDRAIIKDMNVILGSTTAGDILKTIAVDQNPSRTKSFREGRLERTYRYQKLKDAYDSGLLSLWTIEDDSDFPKEKIPVDAPITETHGNKFYIRYGIQGMRTPK